MAFQQGMIEGEELRATRIQDRLTISFKSGGEIPESLEFSFTRPAVKEVTRLAGSIAVEFAQPAPDLFTRMGVVCNMLDQAAAAVASA